MKKILKGLLIIVISLLFVQNVNAAGSANIALGTSSNQIIVGKQITVYVTISSNLALGAWEYTLNFDSSVFKLASSDVPVHYAGYASNATTYSVTYKYIFTALKSAYSKFYIDSSAVADFVNESSLQVTEDAKSVRTLTYSEYQSTLSGNNNLSDLVVEDYEISPKFDKDILEYNVKVPEDTKKVKVIAYVADNSATVTGEGELEVTSGTNSFNIIVVAQNGSEKTYKLNVEVVDKDPIEVTINNEKYTVVKIKDNLNKPESYKDIKVKIKDFDIPAFTSDVTKFTLVGLKNSKGNISLFIYDNDKYTKYIELNFGNLIVYPLEITDLLEDSKKEKMNVLGNNIEVLSLKNTTRYKVINALNIQNNEKGFYLFDSKDNTLIKYDEDYMYNMDGKIKLLTYSTFAFIITTVLMGIVVITTNNKKRKTVTKKEVESPIEDNNEIKENNISEEIEKDSDFAVLKEKSKKKKKH